MEVVRHSWECSRLVACFQIKGSPSVPNLELLVLSCIRRLAQGRTFLFLSNDCKPQVENCYPCTALLTEGSNSSRSSTAALLPCEYMTYQLEPRLNTVARKGVKSLLMDSKVTVVEQMDGFTFSKLLAEIGGYFGLFWGVSTLSIVDLLR